MQTVLWSIIFILVVLLGIFGLRLWCYRRQISHVISELSSIEKEDTNYRLTSTCPIGKTEEMITSMNRVIEKHRTQENALKRENKIYKESITGISHDIRTPLTSAKGYIQMLQKEEVSEEKKREYTDVVKRRLDDVSGMLSQLFEYARIEAGELTMEPEVFLAGNVFAETLSMFYEDFIKAGFEPEVEICTNPCYVNVDKKAFVRIVENLIKNALVHGTGGYELSLNEMEKQVVIRTSNRTDSIEAGDMEYIFDRFYTTDQSRSRKTTGLGLSIVKRFAEQMGGKVEAFLEGNVFAVEVRIPRYEKGR